MSSTAPVELDFLGLRLAAAAADQHSTTTTTCSSSIRGIRTSAIASIGTQQLRRVIASADQPPPPPTTMTLFYNGAVATFDDAEAIMRIAAEVVSSNKAHARGNTLVGNLAKDTPLTRTRSLQQFLQKRKERLARAGPYQSDAASKLFRVREEAA
ncbi:hypothetical protein PR202_ga20503 [Eleusine coracana subsp. coracana]|uniref:Protein TIFY n=1 Tax=Eleusine coracana subsp. coracana TaxID=191504 RepID=A0AAV5CYD6_ELECO|nr:hypothetical protein PR202_ga20503 [Eleusine coracana subsp. coracana]